MEADASTEIFRCLDREIWLITARAGNHRSGLIATHVSCASLVPTMPRVTVGLAKHHYTHELIEQSNAFCMHLIDEAHLDWVWQFGISTGRHTDKLQGLATRHSDTGSPILAGAVAWLDCRVETQMDTGDRSLYLAEVLAARLQEAATPLTVRRLIELAPPSKLGELHRMMERDIELDRQAILHWRQRPND